MPYWKEIRHRLSMGLVEYFQIETRIPVKFQNLLAQIKDQEEPKKPFAWS